MPTLATCCKLLCGLALVFIMSHGHAHSLGHDEHHKPHASDARPEPPPAGSDTQTAEVPAKESVDSLITRYALTGNDELIDRGWSLLGSGFEQGVSGSERTATPDQWLQAAWLAQAEHRFELARSYLDKVLALRPRHAQAWMLKAAVATVEADYDGARYACRQVSLSVAPVVALACQLRVAQDAEQRALLLNRVSRLSLKSLDTETRAWVWSVRGDALMQSGELDQAITAYQHSVDLKSSVQARASLADALMDKQQYAKAMALLNADRHVPALGVRYLMAAREADKGHGAHHHATAIAHLHELFSTWIARQDFRHAREMAMFYVSVKPDPKLAHVLATENYRYQREPEDLALLNGTASRLALKRSL